MALVAIIELDVEAWRISSLCCDSVGQALSRGMWRCGDWYWVVK